MAHLTEAIRTIAAKLAKITSLMGISVIAIATPGCLGVGGADDPAYDPYTSVGSSAHDLLSSDHFKSMAVEVQAVRGYEPSPAALLNVKSFLEMQLNKPGGIEIITDPSLPSTGKTRLSTDEVRTIEKLNRSHFSEGDRLVAYFLFVDAGYDKDTANYNTLGQAYWNTSMTVFEPTVRRVAVQTARTPQAYALSETMVMLHELGHILGLVDTGTPATSHHHDEPHGAHCTNPACLMHYSIENGLLAHSFITGQIPELDDACQADLHANGGK